MFDSGIYVSFMSDDSAKKKAPRSVVVIDGMKVDIYVNPDAHEDTKTYLGNTKKELATLKGEDFEVTAIIRLGKYWEWNGYTPNPSDFFELDDDKGKQFLKDAQAWK